VIFQLQKTYKLTIFIILMLPGFYEPGKIVGTLSVLKEKYLLNELELISNSIILVSKIELEKDLPKISFWDNP